VEVIQKLLESRIARVKEQAVSDPNKLPAEPLEKAIAREMTRQLGEDVEPGDVIFGALKRLSKEDRDTVALRQWLALWHALEDRFGQLNRAESLGVAYGLFPAMRPFLDDIAKSGGREFCPPNARPIDLALTILAGPEGRELLDALERTAKRS
jgi:hypothetical protein